MPGSSPARADDFTRHDHRAAAHGIAVRRGKRKLCSSGPRTSRRFDTFGSVNDFSGTCGIPAGLSRLFIYTFIDRRYSGYLRTLMPFRKTIMIARLLLLVTTTATTATGQAL